MAVKVRAVMEDWYSRIRLGIFDSSDAGYFVGKITMEKRESTVLTASDESLQITKEAAQLLMDDLWHCGIRPTDGTGSVGQLQATEKHLEDMRTLVAHNLGKEHL